MNVLYASVHLEMVEMVNFMLCVFYHNKKNGYSETELNYNKTKLYLEKNIALYIFIKKQERFKK